MRTRIAVAVGVTVALTIACSEPPPVVRSEAAREATRAAAEQQPQRPPATLSEPRVVQALEARSGMTETRVCVDGTGQYTVVAEAGNLDAAASAFLTRDGEHVASALRYRGMPRSVRSAPVALDVACYTLAAQTGINGVRAVARLEQVG